LKIIHISVMLAYYCTPTNQEIYSSATETRVYCGTSAWNRNGQTIT